jgi:hypothetical protein
MRENRTSGSVRGVPGNRHSYRERGPFQFFPKRGGVSRVLFLERGVSGVAGYAG